MYYSAIKNSKHTAFTLIETLVSISIFTILMLGIGVLFKGVYSNSNQQKISIDNTDQARIIIFNFANELRNVTLGNDGSYPLNQAGDSQVILFTSYGATGSNVNRVRYYSSSTKLYKGIVTPSGNPLTYNLASEVNTPILNGLSGTSSIFFYYDGNYSGTSTPLSQPVNLTQVKFIKMNLIVLKQDVTNATGTFSIAAGATLRNLKTNLGN